MLNNQLCLSLIPKLLCGAVVTAILLYGFLSVTTIQPSNLFALKNKASLEDDTDPLQAMKARNLKVDLLTRQVRVMKVDAGVRFVVPNIVHYIWFKSNRTFSFLNYLSFRSVNTFIKPDYVFLHGDSIPEYGQWWNQTLKEVDNLYFVWVNRTTHAPSGQLFKYFEHSTDLLRIKTEIDYGGIYLDTDILIFKSFDNLRQHDMVMGRELPEYLNSGIIVARRDALFLNLWFETYRSYAGQNETWGGKATSFPHLLAKLYPHLIHVEENTLCTPSWKKAGMQQLYLGHYNWTRNYAMHIWNRKAPVPVPVTPNEIDWLNSTLGEVMRFVLYGSKEFHARKQSKTKHATRRNL
jgi:hypothetical protein